MKQTEYDFSKCLFNPNSTNFTKAIQEQIQEFKDYKGKLPIKKLFAWIVVCYDLNSPIRKTITNYYDRKKLSAEIASWDTNVKGEFEEEVTKFLLGQDDEVNTLIVHYLVQFSMPEMLQLEAYLQMSYSIMMEIMKGSTDSAISKNLDYITEKIKLLTNIIYGSGQVDEVMAARKALYDIAEKERIRLNPENIVKIIIEEGVLPESFSPYGKNYKPADIKFISDEGEA